MQVNCYNKPVIKAIILDCYGVLTEDGWTPFKQKYIAGKPEVEMAIKLLGRDVDIGKRTDEDMIRETARLVNVEESVVRKALTVQVPNEQLLSFIEDELKPTYKIGMLSNASHDVVSMLFADRPGLFDSAVMSHQVGMVKPDPRIFELIADRLGALLSECLFIDDQPRFCAGAESAGMQAILFEDSAQCILDIRRLLQQ